jgi:DHA2 family methylenomycin A resistance protein-like MFS transporter
VPLLVVEGGPAAGVILAPMLAGAAVFAPLGGRLADRFGRRAPAVVGNVLIALSFGGLVPLDLTERPILVGFLLGVAGMGLGLSASAVQTAGAEALPAHQAGVAAGVSSSARYLGSILGTSLLALLVAGGDGTRVFGVAAVAGAVAAAASLGVVRSKRAGAASAAAPAPADRDAPDRAR